MASELDKLRKRVLALEERVARMDKWLAKDKKRRKPEPRETREFVACFDGGSRGNPGISGAGAVVYHKGDEKNPCAKLSEFVDENQTNNFAEYRGLLLALRWAVEHQATTLMVHGDSKLILNHMMGKWKCKSAKLKPLFFQCRDLAAQIDVVTYDWVPRAENSEADALANEAMDRHS